MIEVYKTNIPNKLAALKVQKLLLKHFKNAKISIDLEDCDKVLRIEHQKFNINKVIEIVQSSNYNCEILNY